VSAEENPDMAQGEIGIRAEQVLLQTILEKARGAPAARNNILSETGMLYPFARLGGVLQEYGNQVLIPYNCKQCHSLNKVSFSPNLLKVLLLTQVLGLLLPSSRDP
jgi:hypothetical protein